MDNRQRKSNANSNKQSKTHKAKNSNSNRKQKVGGRVKPKTGPLDLEEMVALIVVALLVCYGIYYLYKKFSKPTLIRAEAYGATKSSKFGTGEKYIQDDPYNAKVDLQERYGGLEKRLVNIDDISTEQLILLERDGKLSNSTIEKLRREGRLPAGNDVGANRNSGASVTPTRVDEVVQPLKSRKKKKK